MNGLEHKRHTKNTTSNQKIDANTQCGDGHVLKVSMQRCFIHQGTVQTLQTCVLEHVLPYTGCPAAKTKNGLQVNGVPPLKTAETTEGTREANRKKANEISRGNCVADVLLLLSNYIYEWANVPQGHIQYRIPKSFA